MSSSSCTVLIAASGLLPALKATANATGGEVIAFTDGEALRALDVIADRIPALVVLERLFATTSRGAALIERVKADPRLQHSEVRVVSAGEENAAATATAHPRPPSSEAMPKATAAGQTIDERGTRREPRVPIGEKGNVHIDGNPATLVDLSSRGAQVVSPTVLRPGQRVRVVISDQAATVRIAGTIAWASFEIAPGRPPCYRAGIEFLESDSALRAFCLRHQA